MVQFTHARNSWGKGRPAAHFHRDKVLMIRTSFSGSLGRENSVLKEVFLHGALASNVGRFLGMERYCTDGAEYQ